MLTMNEPAIRVLPEKVNCERHDVWFIATAFCPFCVYERKV